MKTAIFFGAGASKADGAPLQKDLITEYFEMRKQKNKNGIAKEDEYLNSSKTTVMQFYIEKKISYFLSEYFGVDFGKHISKIAFPTFEEILGLIDNASMNDDEFRSNPQINKHQQDLMENLKDHYQLYDNQHFGLFALTRSRLISSKSSLKNMFHNSPGIPSNKIFKIRDCFIFLMAEILEYNLQVDSLNTQHYKLINNIKNLSDISFFSTNYDLLIDSALVHNGCDINYNYDERTKDKVDLFKLHGSLNYLYCPACKNILTYGIEKVVVKTLDYDFTCQHCSSIMKNIIIAPSYFKDFRNKYLQRIWSNAEYKLKQIEHIIFCGYSFPDADFHIKYLLKQSQINYIDSPLKKISIINNFEGKKPFSVKEEFQRYKRLFGNAIDVIDTKLSFQQFASNPYQIIR